MSGRDTITELTAEARYYRDRVALRRAKAYRGVAGSDVRMRELERSLASAERRLHEARRRQTP